MGFNLTPIWGGLMYAWVKLKDRRLQVADTRAHAALVMMG